MDLWGRGTSFALANGETHLAERTKLSIAGGTPPTGTVSRQALTASGYEDQEYYLRINHTALGTSVYEVIFQRIESVRTLSGKRATFSFWMASDVPGKQVWLSAIQRFGSGGSTEASFAPVGNPIYTLSSVIQRFDVTFNVPSISGKILGIGDHLEFQIFTVNTIAGVANYTGNVDLIRWQVNEGPKADFETAGRSTGEEVMLAQRFFERGFQNCNGMVINATQCYINGIFRQPKRAIPTVALDPNISTTSNVDEVGTSPRTATSATSTGVSTHNFTVMLTVPGGGMTVYRPVRMNTDAFWFDAEF